MGSKFQKGVVRPLSYLEIPPPPHEKQNCLNERRGCGEARIELMPFQCKDRRHTDKSDVFTTTLQWINAKIFYLTESHSKFPADLFYY